MALKTFFGGVHPKDNKSFSKDAKLEHSPLPAKVIISLSQHIGGLPSPIIKVGDTVKTGQKIAEPSGFVSIPMHSSISGKVKAIERFTHPSGAVVTGIEIESDGKDEWIDLIDEKDFISLPPDEMKNRIAEAGICGMGGAGFPTHVKISPPKDTKIDTVILNGVECEPYLTADYRIMLEKPEEILNGLKILMKVVGATNGVIGIEENKPDAIKIMSDIVKNEPNIRVQGLKLKYPQGAEKQLLCFYRKKST